MNVLVWLLRGVVFIVLVALAAKNSDTVTVRFLFGAAWDLPLNFLMLVFFTVGAGIGATAALGTIVRQRRELGRLRKASWSADAHGPPAQRSGSSGA